MTTQKEFHELIREMEESENKLISLEPSEIDCTGYILKPMHKFNLEFLDKSRQFVPLAIKRIKRLERALEIAQKNMGCHCEDLAYRGCRSRCGQCLAREQIKKELEE